MEGILKIVVKMAIGLMCCALSTVMAIQSNLGLCPWDVFHQGISNVTGVSIGMVNVAVGCILVAVTVMCRLEIGVGTLINMVIVGIFIDFINYLDFMPEGEGMVFRVAILVLSLIFQALGSYFYLSCGIGCGPRDGLMVLLVRLTNRSVRMVRFTIETLVLVVGYMLGGKFGIGTVITALTVGFWVQGAFKLFKFDVKSLKHRSLGETVAAVRGLAVNLKKDV